MTFSPEQLARFDRPTAVSLGFPHDFLALDPARAISFGGLRDRIEAWNAG